jgi:hypothetical protein
MPVAEIVGIVLTGSDRVRDATHHFNADGSTR